MEEYSERYKAQENAFLQKVSNWARSATTEELADYIQRHDDDPLYENAIQCIIEESNRRSRIDGCGYGADMI